MRRTTSLFSVMAAAIALGACGGTDVVVQAQASGLGDAAAADAGATPLSGVEVLMLPFDRDIIFDSLAQTASMPEPQIPDTLLALQEQIAEANVAYQAATARWNVVRDSLRELSEDLQGLSPASPQYRVLFGEFNDLEGRVSGLERQMNESFARFSGLQRRFTTQAEEIRLQRAQWGDEAFRAVDSIFAARQEATGREILVDTTNANGMVRFSGVANGEWWVHARYPLPYEELYWNEPVQVEGDVVEVLLNRESAETRPQL